MKQYSFFVINRPCFIFQNNVQYSTLNNHWKMFDTQNHPGGVTWDFFRGSFRQNHVPWGRPSLWKWVAGISPGVKAAYAFGWRRTTLVVLKVEMIRGLNLPGTPWATSACRGIPLLYFFSEPLENKLSKIAYDNYINDHKKIFFLRNYTKKHKLNQWGTK